MRSRPAIFLDKDGTLVNDVPYNVDPARIHLCTGADNALARLSQVGYQFAVVSNQSGVARGFFDESALVAVEQRIRELLNSAGVALAGFYYCPHSIEGSVSVYAVDCDCRKPKPGLLQRAARELHLDLSRSWMIGDILDDIEAGHLAGCRSILLMNGGETLWDISGCRIPDHIAKGWDDAANWILLHTLDGMESYLQEEHAHV
jgi:histidinol-phosphate phosphatase family protein